MNVSWLIMAVAVFSAVLAWGKELKGLPDNVPSAGGTVRLQKNLMPATQEEAEKLFIPVEKTVPKVRLQEARNGEKFLLFPVNFKEGTHGRVYWDAAARLDWSAGASVIFDFIAGRQQDVLGMYLFLHSGNGWYVAPFGLDTVTGWNRISLRKDMFSTEGQPQGWNRIDRIRISCWKRSETQDGWLGLANLGMSREQMGKPLVAIVRGDACGKKYPGEADSFLRYAETLRTGLLDSQIPVAVLSDETVTARQLKEYKLVMIPHNPYLPEQALEALTAFARQGGKIMGFFVLPKELQALLQISYAKPGIAAHPSGGYGGFLATDQALPGQPAFVPQASYCTKIPSGEGRRVLATWANPEGTDTKIPAIMVLPRGMYVSHVWQIAKGPYRKELLETLVGEFIPLDRLKRWKARWKLLGCQGGHSSWKQLEKLVRRRNNSQASRELNQADMLKNQAGELLQEKNWQKASPLIRQAQKHADEAFFLCQKSRPKERRLVWCHQPAGIDGWSWEQSIKFLADSGFTDIIVNMCWTGAANYPSRVWPRKSGNKTDQVQECLKACRKFGIGCHVWKVCFNMGNQASKDYERDMIAAGRVQVNRDGAVKSRWLCPSHPLNQRDEINTMLELASNYPGLTGLHFDYIRYSDSTVCYCAGCRRRFEAYLGKSLTSWPFDSHDRVLQAKWHVFRRRAISAVVRDVHHKVKAMKSQMELSAAVYSNWPMDRDGVGQDWGRWCKKGWLDFVCPMDYRDNDLSFRSLVRLQCDWRQGAGLYPGIGISCWEEGNDPYRLVRQIDIVRKLGIKGFTIFNYDRHAVEALRLCGLGCTKP